MRQQQVYFNHVVTGCPALRTFEIHNVWERLLLFDIGGDTSEIQVSSGVRADGGRQRREWEGEGLSMSVFRVRVVQI